MKGLLFSWVMRTRSFFMWRSRAPPPLPPASVFRLSLLRSSTFLSRYLNPLSRLLWVFLFFCLPLFSSSCLCRADFFLCSFCPLLAPITKSEAVDNNKQLPKIVGGTLVALLCPPINLSHYRCLDVGREYLWLYWQIRQDL